MLGNPLNAQNVADLVARPQLNPAVEPPQLVMVIGDVQDYIQAFPAG